MTTATRSCPVCGLRGCAAGPAEAEAVSPDVLVRLHTALATAPPPSVSSPVPPVSVLVTQPLGREPATPIDASSLAALI